MEPIEFIHNLRWQDIPKPVQHQIKRCLLDTIGAAIAGRRTKLSSIVYEFVCTAFQGREAQLWLDGRRVSAVGAALAHGMTIDAIDIHDNFNQAKGHAGVAIVPAAMATLHIIPGVQVSGRELLTSIGVGYEVALRAGLALHATACDYHTSGAWNSLGCAATVARRLGSTEESTRHALGIAEYHGPRSQMMRCIDHPTMLKDGSGWGAMAGVSAGMLAERGFTGAPAVTVELEEVSNIWADIGERWYLLEQDFKRHAVCHWAQPAITGVMNLLHTYYIDPEEIELIQVYTFHEATRLTCRRPRSTEQAQYSLPFPVAAAVIYDRLGPEELSGAALTDRRVLNLADRVELLEDDVCNGKFPRVQMARVRIRTLDGRTFESDPAESPWDNSEVQQPEQPPDAELQEKFHWLVSDSLAKSRANEIEAKIWHLEELPDAGTFSNLLVSP